MSFHEHLATIEPFGVRLIEDFRYELKNELTGSGFSKGNVPADSTS